MGNWRRLALSFLYLMLLVPGMHPAPTWAGFSIPDHQLSLGDAVVEVRLAASPADDTLMAMVTTDATLFEHQLMMSSNGGVNWSAVGSVWLSTKSDSALTAAGGYYYVALPDPNGLSVFLRRYAAHTGLLDPNYNGLGNETYELPVTRPMGTRVEAIEMDTTDADGLQILISYSDGSLQAFAGATHPVNWIVGNLDAMPAWRSGLSMKVDRGGGGNRLVFSYITTDYKNFAGRITSGAAPIYLPIAIDLDDGDAPDYLGIDDRASIAGSGNRALVAVEFSATDSPTQTVFAALSSDVTGSPPPWNNLANTSLFGDPARHAQVVADRDNGDFVIANLRQIAGNWQIQLTRVGADAMDTNWRTFLPNAPVTPPSPLEIIQTNGPEFVVAYLSGAPGMAGTTAHVSVLTLPRPEQLFRNSFEAASE